MCNPHKEDRVLCLPVCPAPAGTPEGRDLTPPYVTSRSPDLKPPPSVPPTMWPTSRHRPNCASTWTRPSSSWCGLSGKPSLCPKHRPCPTPVAQTHQPLPTGSTRNKSSRPAHPTPPGRRTGAAPASSCSADMGGTTSTSSRDQLPSLSPVPDLGHTTRPLTVPGLLWTTTVCLLPSPLFPARAPGGGTGLPGIRVTAVYNPLPKRNKHHCHCQKVLFFFFKGKWLGEVGEFWAHVLKPHPT